MLIGNHPCCNLDQFLVQHSLDDVGFGANQIDFVEEREFCRLPSLWVQEELLVTAHSFRGHASLCLFLRGGAIPEEVDVIEVVSLLQDPQRRHILIFAHDVGVLRCRLG